MDEGSREEVLLRACKEMINDLRNGPKRKWESEKTAHYFARINIWLNSKAVFFNYCNECLRQTHPKVSTTLREHFIAALELQAPHLSKKQAIYDH